MKAWLLNDINNYELVNRDIPQVGEDQVLVKVHACGICGSDIPRVYVNGAHKMPLIIGHEFSGEIAAIGNENGIAENGRTSDRALKYKLGDRVGIFPLIPCMKCGPCLEKHYEMCRHYDYLGSRCDGGFAEYVAVHKWNLIKLPKGVSYEAAAMLEPMSVAVHAMRRILNTEQQSDSIVSTSEKDKIIAVYGLGTIGTLLSLFLLDSGYKNIYVIGNKDFQKKTMTDMGLSEGRFCDSRSTDVKKWIFDKTDGQGVDCFFECIGKNETMSQAIDLMVPGGSVCLVGNPYSDMKLEREIYWKILRNQLKVTGTWNSSFIHDEEDDWHYVLRRLEGAYINPEKLITQHLSIDNLEQGFKLMRDKSEDYIKVMMVG